MSVFYPKGYRAPGVAAGIKPGGVPDLDLVASANGPVIAAATFTSNLAAAAPVQVSRALLGATGGRVSAVILNSGCANAATGRAGPGHGEFDSPRRWPRSLGIEVDEVLVCSTGLIGPQLDLDAVLGALPEVVRSLGENAGDGDRRGAGDHDDGHQGQAGDRGSRRIQRRWHGFKERR